MLKVVWNIVKSVLGAIFSIFRPLKRLVCRRRKLSESDGSELTSIGSGNLMISTPHSYGEDNGEDADIEMESWEAWEDQAQQNSNIYPNQQRAQSSPYGPGGDYHMNGFGSKPVPAPSQAQNYHYNQKLAQPEPEPEINFFEDMTPEVKRQRKILIRKKEASMAPAASSVSNRLTVMSDVPLANSELEAWQDETNAWDTGEALEDLTWQAEEAIKEKRRIERMERQMEQQKRKQKKEEMRGMKSGSLIATKLS